MDQNIPTLLLWLAIGIAAVSIIDYFGSIISRRFNINYGWFTIFSFLVYTYLGYTLMVKLENKTWVLACCIVVGVYDGIVGWNISRRMNAYLGEKHQEILDRTTPASNVIMGIIWGLICGAIGIYFATGEF